MGFKDRCIALRKQDHTLGEIAKITGRPKTSVYAHIHSIPLSAEKRRLLRATHGARIRAFAIARRGKSTRPFIRIREWDAPTVFLVSHILFDGDFNVGGFSYNNRSDALIRRVEAAVRTIYSFDPRRYPNLITGVQRISYFNVALRAHIKEMAALLLKQIIELPKEYKRVFLQAFFDDEGCIDFRPSKNTRRVRGYQKNLQVLYLVQKLLREFSIDSFVARPNEVVIAHKENLEKFQKEIGFSSGVRINGRRSNSIWKRSLEKRELLRRAIASYKPIGSNGVHRSTPSNANDSGQIANGPT